MGLSISNPSATVNSKLLVTKTNTAGQVNLGANPYTSVVVTASSSAASYTSWVQYVASTSADLVITGLTVKVASIGTADFPTIIQIGVGGAGSETSLTDLPIHGTGSTVVPVFVPTQLRITSGSRIAVRAYVVSTNGASISCGLFGVAYANLEGN